MTAPTLQDIRDRLADRLDDLIEPRSVSTRRWVHRQGTDALVPEDVVVRMPGLLGQLARRDPSTTVGRSSTSSGSRPPGSLAAVDTLLMIDREARPLAARLITLRIQATAEGVQLVAHPRRLIDAVRIIRAAVPELDRAWLRSVDRTVVRWWARARITMTWDEPPLRPHVPCPACGRRGGLQLVRDPLAMACLDCGEAWAGSSDAELVAAVQRTVPRSADDPTPPRHAEPDSGSVAAAPGDG